VGSDKRSGWLDRSTSPRSIRAEIVPWRLLAGSEGADRRAATTGPHLKAKFEEFLDLDCIGDVRGEGLFLGIEFVQDKATRAPFAPELAFAKTVEAHALELGAVTYACRGTVQGTKGDHMLFAPPLALSLDEADELAAIMRAAIQRTQDGLWVRGCGRSHIGVHHGAVRRAAAIVLLFLAACGDSLPENCQVYFADGSCSEEVLPPVVPTRPSCDNIPCLEARSLDEVCEAYIEAIADDPDIPFTPGAAACDPGVLDPQGLDSAVRAANFGRWPACRQWPSTPRSRKRLRPAPG